MSGLTRRRFISLTSATATAALLPTLTLHAQSKDSHLPLPGETAAFSDPIDALNLLLQVQHAELRCYQGAIDASIENPLIAPLAEIEVGHVRMLEEAILELDGTPTVSPEFSFEFADVTDVLATASSLESLAVSCVQGLAGSLHGNPTMLNAALAVHESDARHVAVIESQQGNIPFPLAIHPTLLPAAIEESLASFGR